MAGVGPTNRVAKTKDWRGGGVGCHPRVVTMRLPPTVPSCLRSNQVHVYKCTPDPVHFMQWYLLNSESLGRLRLAERPF